MDPIPEHNYPLRLLAALDALGETPAITAGATTLSGARMSQIIRGVAERLAEHGVGKTNTVLISFVDGAQSFIAVLAASLLGATWVVYEKALPYKALRNLVVVGDGKLQVVGNLPQFVVDAKWLAGAGKGNMKFRGYERPEDICAIASSSGTTGAPKFMFRSAVSTTLGLSSIAANAGHQEVQSPRVPIASFLGFQLLMSVLVQGGRVVLPEPSRQPGELHRMSEAGVNSVVGSPLQISALCAGVTPPERKLGTLLVGGAVITPTMLAQWLKYFDKVRVAYGSRESAGGAMVTFDAPTDTSDLAYVVRPDCEVGIVDENDRDVPPGETGIIRFRREHMVTSYIDDPVETAKVFRNGWFHPGDLGRLDEQGRLHITGRLHDQLNVGGIKFNAATADAATARVDGVEAAMCFVTEGPHGEPELKVCVCLRPGLTAGDVADAIRTEIRASVRGKVKAVYAVDAVPVNGNGKPLREHGAVLTAAAEPA